MNIIRTAMLLAFMTALFMGVGYLIGGSGGMMIAFLIAAGMNLFSYWNADKMVLRCTTPSRSTSATRRNITPSSASSPARAGLPMPKVYLIDNPQPNAFATGRNPQNAAVAATTGLLERLSREEVAGVMAHELAHVKNRDTLTMTITATLAGAISMLGNFAFFFGGNRDNNNPLGFVGVLVAMIVAPLAAMLVQMAISRTREYSADRRGAEICGNPLWLASALDKIARAADASPIRTPSAIRRPRISSSSIRCPASAWTICSRPIRRRRTASPRCEAMAARSGGDAGRRRSVTTRPDEAPQAPIRGAATRPGRATASRARGRERRRPRGTAGRRPQRGAGSAVPPTAPANVPGLAARQAAAKLLAAVIDARTPLDGLTDHEHGHPQLPRARHARPRAGARDPGDRAALSRHDRRG